jgi:hypothetical protein
MRKILAMLLAYKYAKRNVLVQVELGMPDHIQYIENVFELSYAFMYKLLTREY